MDWGNKHRMLEEETIEDVRFNRSQLVEPLQSNILSRNGL